MDAKELRIGNYLRDIISKTTLEVVELTKDDIVTYVIDRSMFPLKEGWGLEPIPLNNEWLIKLGFKRDGDEYSKDNFIIRPNRRDLIIEGFEYDYNGIIVSTEHFYVHDLQNLYFAIKRYELECN